MQALERGKSRTTKRDKQTGQQPEPYLHQVIGHATSVKPRQKNKKPILCKNKIRFTKIRFTKGA